MAPLAVYIVIVLAVLGLAVALRFLIVVPRRDCIGCGRSISVATHKCRWCGYEYSHEDRALRTYLKAKRLRAFNRGR
jgi:hypothetical protein